MEEGGKKTEKERHKDSGTERRTQRTGSRGGGVTGESLRPTARESRVAGGQSLSSKDQMSGAGAGRSERLSLLQAGPDNKLHFHGGAAAAAGGTLMVPRGDDEDLAFRTHGRQAVPDFMMPPRSWEGAAVARMPAPETLSACARRVPCWPRMPAHPLPGLERCGIFCLRRGGHMDGKGLQVAKLGGPGL